MGKEPPVRPVKSIIASSLMVIGACCVGLLLSFHKTFFSCFALMQAGPIDSRLNNFILEHSYRWLLGWQHHQDLFNPGLLASSNMLMAFTDILLGLAPFYWGWRGIGFDPETSYQFWMLTLATVNFLACFLLLSRFLRIGMVGATFGSFILAFNTAQATKVMHQQLIPHFYVLSSIMALLVIFRSQTSRTARRAAVFIFFLSWVAQFYSSFYNFFLLGLPFGAALIWALIVPSWRKTLLELVKNDYIYLALATLLALVLMWPLLSLYLSRIDSIGYIEQTMAKPKAYIWFLTGHSNLLYGWIRSGPFGYLQGGQFSQGIGLLTSAAACVGFFLLGRTTAMKLTLLGFATTVLATTYLTDTIGLWPYLREIIPGAKGIRTICRIGMIQLIPAAIGTGLLVCWLVRSRRWVILILIMSVCSLEQVNLGGKVLSKQRIQEEVQQFADRVDPEASGFLLLPRKKRADLTELAFWVALRSRRPTLNLRYLYQYLFSKRADAEQVKLYLEQLEQRNVQLIEVGPE